MGSITEQIWDNRYTLTLLILLFPLWQQWSSYQRLSKFKGPFWASLTNLWMAKNVGSGEVYKKVNVVSQKYGDLVRVGPNTLYTTNPEFLHRMSSARSGYVRSNWYNGQRVEPNGHQVFSLANEKEHTQRRAQVAIGYSGKEIDGLEAMVDKHVAAFVGLIRKSYVATKSELRTLDFARVVSFFTMDVITDVAFGNSWGFVAADEDIGKWCESCEAFIPAATMVSTLPWLAKFLDIPIISQMIMPSDQDKTGPGRLLGLIKDTVDQRFGLHDNKQKRDMLGSFLRHGLTKPEVVSECSLQVIAGSDTTASAIRATLLYIITNPHVYQKLQAEIDSVPISNTIIQSSKARSLPYLQAVIKEGIRIWPASTLPVLKVVPPEGDTINGIFIPGGTEIGVDQWAMQHSKEHFGHDADRFRPERWLENDGETLQKMESTMGLVFGSGKYGCLGKNIAMLELDKMFFELLKNFDFELINPATPWRTRNYGLWFQDSMFVSVKDRLSL